MHESASAERPGTTPTPAGETATPLPGPRPSRVGAALAQLPLLDETPLAGHPDLYQQIHGELQGSLAEIDNA